MDDQPDQKKPEGKIGELIKYLLLFAVIGSILACSGAWVFTSKFASNWRELEPAPPRAAKIVGGGMSDVFVQDQDGQVYSCDTYQKEECWIPDVVPADYPKIYDCDQSHAAFQFYQKPPKDMISCIQLQWVDPHFSGTIIMALNKNGEIWQWQHGAIEYGFLLYPIGIFAGAAVGLLLGSLLWFTLRIIRKRGREGPLMTRNEAIIILIPWGVVVLCMGAWLIDDLSSKSFSPDNAAQYTAVAKEIAVQLTQAAGERPTEIPKAAQQPFYDLIALACSAAWESRYEAIPCPEQAPSDGAPFLVNPGDNTLEGDELPNTALVMPINSDYFYMNGIYPPLEIEAGDHFRATIGCLNQSDRCDAVYEVSYETQEDNFITLGRWRQVNDGKLGIIDLDLSALAGQSVRVKLDVRRYGDADDQYPAWVSPYIGQ